MRGYRRRDTMSIREALTYSEKDRFLKKCNMDIYMIK